MKRVFLLLTIYLVFTHHANGQKFSKTYFDWWLNKCDTAINIKDVTLYLVDGIAYSPNDSLRLNQVLNSWTDDTFGGVDYFNIGKLPTAHNWNKFVVLISSKRKLSAKQKRSYLKTARSKYDHNIKLPHIASDSTDPVLIVDGKPIFHSDCFDVINKIRVADIAYIYICNSRVPQEYFGQNAKNGLIKIWTNKTS